MTTVLAYKNRVVADKRVAFVPLVGESYVRDVDTKIFKSKCERVAVIFQPMMSDPELISPIVENIAQGMVEKVLDKNTDIIILKRSYVEKLRGSGRIDVTVVTKKGIYACPDITRWLAEDINKGEEDVKVMCAKLHKDTLVATGAGADLAIGMHLADGKLSLKRIIKEVSTLNPLTSEECVEVKCSDLKPIVETKLGVKK